VQPSKAEVLEWERRWAAPVAIAAFAAVALVIAAVVIVTQVGTGSGDATLLRDVDRHRTAQMLSSIIQAIGVGLLAAPLYYLFRAAKARSEKMRGQLIGVVVAAPLFLSALYILASTFVSTDVPQLLVHRVSLSGERANKIATKAIENAPLRSLAVGFGIAGPLGFLVAMVYTSLYAMRTGLLNRFWGALGMALGAVSFIFFEFALLWFIYIGLLVLGKVRGGRPAAWAAGEAIPFPTPGEKASAALSGANGDGSAPSADPEEPASPEPQNGERRKRKQRD
jgi:hypothetical protein